MSPWQPDLCDGYYKNPVLNADYSDPDAIRVGDDYWMTSSSFSHAPGLPILHSRDLVNWTLVNHALPALVPHQHFLIPRHGAGVWAPALRHHAGKFHIYYPDPDYGIYVITTDDPRAKWSTPLLIKARRGLIDPCPLWDDDGQVYLVHGWAKSRSGICNLLTLHRLSADGKCVADEGRVIIDGNKMPGWTTIEGPKFYKRDGWYYIFAPAGGVKDGYQTVFRSRTINGPYEARITLEQGPTPINGPHQGAWITTPAGEDWFFHFQEIPAMGRVVHMQPMTWTQDGWPLMGTAAVASARTEAVKGNPVLTHKKPVISIKRTGTASAHKTPPPPFAPATSDDFSTCQPDAQPALQWQWQANPEMHWARVDTASKTLYLTCVPKLDDKSHWMTPNLLMQKFPAGDFTATVIMRFPLAPAATTTARMQIPHAGAHAGLMIFGYDYAWLGLRMEKDGRRNLVLATYHKSDTGTAEQTTDALPISQDVVHVHLRANVRNATTCSFSWSADGRDFQPIGEIFKPASSKWVGAKFGLFASSPSVTDKTPAQACEAHAEFSNFCVTP